MGIGTTLAVGAADRGNSGAYEIYEYQGQIFFRDHSHYHETRPIKVDSVEAGIDLMKYSAAIAQQADKEGV